MNKRKLLTLAMTLCMVAILAIGGTLAYFTDSDFNKNVMVTGNVNIDQIEEQRGEDGNMVAYVDNKPLYPVTQDHVFVNGVFDDPNVVDKFVSVKNTGNTDAFIRTIFAFEMSKDGEDMVVDKYVHLLSKYNAENQTIGFGVLKEDNDGQFVTFKVGETQYIAAVYYYTNDTAYDSEGLKKSALEPGETSQYSLKQLWLDKDADNTFYEKVGGEFDVLVLSQAVQTEGFDTAKEALDAAYGKITNANAAEWFASTASKDISKDASEMKAIDTRDNK